jgi:repressor LexA
MTFGERVKARREELNMTQEDLAKKVGFKSRASINKIELDKRNMKQSQIVELAKALETTPGYLMGWHEDTDHIPKNLSVPSARAIPIIGDICAGNGILTNEDFTGFFFVDNSIKADYTLFVRGDSMVGAGINDGDIAFLSKNFEFEDGKIYGVVYGAEKECVLKKVYKQGETVILQPCNDSYKPIIVRADDVWIIGIVIGTYRGIS